METSISNNGKEKMAMEEAFKMKLSDVQQEFNAKGCFILAN